jgi:hypothetical protein
MHKCTYRELKVFYMNVHSIVAEHPTLLSHLSSYNPDIIAFAETWLTENFALIWPGYKAIRRDRIDINENGRVRSGGGLLILVKQSLELTCTTKFEYNDNILSLDFEYKSKCEKCNRETKKNFDFHLVYRRPGPYKDLGSGEFSAQNDVFIDKIKLAARQASTASVFVGDFNFKIEHEHPSQAEIVEQFKAQSYVKYDEKTFSFANKKQRELNDDFVRLGFKQLISFPTHGSGNVLDLIYARSHDFVSEVSSRGFVPTLPNRYNRDKLTPPDHCMITFSLAMN